MFINAGVARNNGALPHFRGVYQRAVMPTLHLEMHPGRTLEQKRAFVREATRVAVETLACPPESVDIVITEVPREAWAKGGKLVSDA
ncbi:MAG: 4-oxalocrotonate tautomerase [Rhodanobacter sp.]